MRNDRAYRSCRYTLVFSVANAAPSMLCRSSRASSTPTLLISSSSRRRSASMRSSDGREAGSKRWRKSRAMPRVMGSTTSSSAMEKMRVRLKACGLWCDSTPWSMLHIARMTSALSRRLLSCPASCSEGFIFSIRSSTSSSTHLVMRLTSERKVSTPSPVCSLSTSPSRLVHVMLHRVTSPWPGSSTLAMSNESMFISRCARYLVRRSSRNLGVTLGTASSSLNCSPCAAFWRNEAAAVSVPWTPA
mmetsp:Transcript_35610/g.100269  ORF Transcript_35610/g.100269 Transcript_35610/m.100269 type:complete len:246 (+) Transcript_35610:1802-2539(+)